ncbi:MFS transporter [Saccharothrix coeruleofusca]|uniref:MFS transporter n=1 Tax=Saccharothrix coeruleofusca TaxID=33919 RepID=A0A918AR91_9PSEU|nr:MFS transporter [Saccharothrix coeruleofusca]GGP74473.1 MFS transporter [Saccharothrix coeruleofusca]
MSSFVQVETTRTPVARWIALAAITTAALMVVLDASVINIALPRMQQELELSDTARGWAVTAYAVTFGGLLLLGGRIADHVGRKRVLMVSLSGFAVASLIGGLATGPGMLIAARALQGVFAAALAPAALSLVAITFTEPRERARAFAVFAAAQGSGGAIGLLLGGALTETLGWRWSLFINVPIALFALVLGLPTIVRVRPQAGGRHDIPGAVLATIGSSALVAAFSIASEPGGWASPTPYAFLAGALLLIGAFVGRQRRASNPLLPRRIVADRTRGGAYLMAGFTTAGMFGMFLLLPYYLQDHLAFSPLLTGAVIVPFSAALVLASLLVPALVRRLSAKTVLVGGIMTATIAMAGLAVIIALPDALAGVLVSTTVMGAGIGFVFAPLNSSVVAGVAAGDVGVASAMLSVTQQIGGAVGVALLNGIYVIGATAHPELDGISPEALRSTFLVATAFYAISAVVALVVIPTSRSPRSEEPN